MPFFDHLRAFDYAGLRFLNVTTADPYLDAFWIEISRLQKNPIFLYIFLPTVLIYFLYIYRLHALKIFLVLGVTVGLSDALAYRGVKSYIQRARPFENPAVKEWVRKVGDAHGPSFPSNHATNCFALATVLSWYFYRQRNYFYAFALLVGLSRIALGVHFPTDVIAGAMLGGFVGFLVRIFLLQKIRWFSKGLYVSKVDAESQGWRTRSRRL